MRTSSRMIVFFKEKYVNREAALQFHLSRAGDAAEESRAENDANMVGRTLRRFRFGAQFQLCRCPPDLPRSYLVSCNCRG